MEKIKLVEISCDECGEPAYYGEAEIGFVSGKVYCSKCGKTLIATNKAKEIE